ncbi:LytTR family DNA-binding domain-containing protein [Fulvivirga lutimaris]|uniref:LytTR family DNA-binding domain-containing protein n=1 Tax=Fulvivirga lutimaris TaxID=1819566 RepID=UPI0012BC0B1E|nr:LytTR family DNA-binding domain-containing protein [Fulvivirga lutimaris]MTI41168.1 LytTR family transcriptional regulator [Fulvivirga lutimaris]
MEKTRTKIVWRVINPILVGCTANFLINFVFNPQNPASSLKEYLTAIIFSAFITELNHFIDLRLSLKYNWIVYPLKRFLFNLLFLVLALLFVINIIGLGYMWIIENDYFNWHQLLIINLITFFISLVFTIINWTSFFFKNWRASEIVLSESQTKLNSLITKVEKADEIIHLQKGNSKYAVRVADVREARSEHGVVKVYRQDHEHFIYDGSLSELSGLLPDDWFFSIGRNRIVHRESIIRITSSTYGKILISIVGSKEEITVSRLKASKFRKWYYSS